MKKKLLFVVLILISNNNCEEKKGHSYIKLEHEALKYLDGVTGCLDGNAIVDMFDIKKQILQLKDGILLDPTPKRTGKVVGHLIFQGKVTSLKTLIHNEELLANSNSVSNELKKIEIEKCLKEAKTNFIQSSMTFVNKIRGAKELVMNLIKESCEKRNIKHSLLTEWTNTNGNEDTVFNAKVKNVKDFDIFLTHVTDFIGDLIYSCKKGFAEFKQNQIKKNAASGRS